MKKERMNARKKAEIPSTVFVYTTAAVLIALILIFGYSSISKIINTTTTTEVAKFKVDLKDAITTNTGYGKDIFIKMNMPTGFEELCFVSADSFDPNDAYTQEILKRYPEAEEIAKSTNNVFIADAKKNTDKFQVEAFEIEGGKGILCIKQQSGQLKFRVIGRGNLARIAAAG